MNALRIGDFYIPTGIIQGGMGVGISLSGLASAVANEGGVGVISAAGLGILYKDYSKDYLANSITGLKEEIRKARKQTSGLIGVNIMVALSNYEDLVRASIEEGIDIIISGAGLPLDLPKYLTPGCKTKLIPIVSSARAASLICNKWMTNFNYLPDAVIVEGPKAGGHLGFKLDQIFDPNYALEKLIPEVVKAVNEIAVLNKTKIPVIAAGGIYTGADIAEFLKLGASGVQMGTRFVTTHECDASIEFKEAYLKANKEDIKIIKSPVGMPGRAINSIFLEDVESGKRHPKACPVNCIRTCDIATAPYCIMASLTSALRGNFNRGYAFAGSNVWRTDKIISVKELMNTIKQEYDAHSGKADLWKMTYNKNINAISNSIALNINNISTLFPNIVNLNPRFFSRTFPFIYLPIRNT
jgi:NAD(P)H-dependent flavin oxidoreductase YrpB (nitropropane dioxygenase family)